MTWDGFLEESKKYMGYSGSLEKGRYKEVLMFWARFPGAWIKFHIFTLCDKIKAATYKLVYKSTGIILNG